MRPMSYQPTNYTCWVTCILNGIFYVTGTKQGGASLQVYQLLNSVLREDGVYYDNEDDRILFDAVMSGLKELTELEFHSITGAEVGQALQDIKELRFEERVAICDIHNGAHSILLTRKENKNDGVWFSAFDPYWYGDGRQDSEDLKFPTDKRDMNVKIREDHLLATKLGTNADRRNGKAYQMGGHISQRFLTIIGNPKKK